MVLPHGSLLFHGWNSYFAQGATWGWPLARERGDAWPGWHTGCVGSGSLEARHFTEGRAEVWGWLITCPLQPPPRQLGTCEWTTRSRSPLSPHPAPLPSCLPSPGFWAPSSPGIGGIRDGPDPEPGGRAWVFLSQLGVSVTILPLCLSVPSPITLGPGLGEAGLAPCYLAAQL